MQGFLFLHTILSNVIIKVIKTFFARWQHLLRFCGKVPQLRLLTLVLVGKIIWLPGENKQAGLINEAA